ncbi:MAG: lysophospholipid acyltransferase family protein [Methylophilaceae bacterium]
MLNLFSKILSLLPLHIVHALGSALGRCVQLIAQRPIETLRSNLSNSGLFSNQIAYENAVKANIKETGKSFLETLMIWQLSDNEAVSLVKSCHGWEHVEQAISNGNGLIFLTPHLGCYEITSIYYASKHPITVLFRPARQSWLNPLIQRGRSKGQVKLAPATTIGVRLLMQALKRGEAIGILPDQTPIKGEGEWAPFFGKPAYTMALAGKLAEKTGATIIMAFGERLPNGEGFEIHLNKLESGSIANPSLLNQALEAQIKQFPEQYLWAYNRYKISNDNHPPPESKS